MSPADLRTAKVYYLIFGRKGRIRTCSAGSRAGRLPAQCPVQVADDPLHPTLTFELDTSIEHGVRLTQLIDSVTKRGTSTDAFGCAWNPAPRQAARPELAGAVARVKYLFNARKAGHTGSLDPLASACCPSASVKQPSSGH